MVVRALPWGELEAPMLAVNSASFSLRIAVYLATIGPRSRRDRATIVVLAVRRSPFDRLATITPRQPSDRGSIAPRSRFDRTAIVEFFHDRSAPSDVDLKVAGGSRSLDCVNPDYESRPPSDSIFRWLEGHDCLIA